MNTNTDDLIKVLWVEDDPIVTEHYPITAERYGLDLVAFPCWDDAFEALKNGFDTWGAIILDAKCKHHKDSPDNAARFLVEALSNIRAICAEKKHQINWYVLSAAGGAETKQINDLISEDRLRWDKDWTEKNGKLYYSKTEEDIKILFQRVYFHATITERMQIKAQLYRNVFDAMQQCKLHGEAAELMADLLFNLHKNKEGREANSIMWETRKIVEYVFRAMIDEWGMLPAEFVTADRKEKVNLTSSARMLSGLPTDNDKRTVSYSYDVPIINSILNYQIKGIVDQTGEYLHTDRIGGQVSNTSELMASVNNSPYLVYGMTMNLCNILLWFANYVKANPDPNENMKKWRSEAKNDDKKELLHHT